MNHGILSKCQRSLTLINPFQVPALTLNNAFSLASWFRAARGLSARFRCCQRELSPLHIMTVRVSVQSWQLAPVLCPRTFFLFQMIPTHSSSASGSGPGAVLLSVVLSLRCAAAARSALAAMARATSACEQGRGLTTEARQMATGRGAGARRDQGRGRGTHASASPRAAAVSAERGGEQEAPKPKLRLQRQRLPPEPCSSLANSAPPRSTACQHRTRRTVLA